MNSLHPASGPAVSSWWRRALLYIALPSVFISAPMSAMAGGVFKCSNGFQDKPCSGGDVQQRMANGVFSVEQVNPNTNRECAGIAAELTPLWERVSRGETVKRSDIDIEKFKLTSQLPPEAFERLVLELERLRNLTIEPLRLRSEFESGCMRVWRHLDNGRQERASDELKWAEERERGNAQMRASKERQELREICWRKYGRPDC